MLFLISLSVAVLFTALCGDVLKKHPTPFYVGFTAAAILFAVLPIKKAPEFVSDYLIGMFSKGPLAAAFFVIVMFAGAFKAGSKGAKKLMPIRAELAIAASLLTITHLISYGFLYIKRLVTGAISPLQAAVTYFAIPLIILLIPLAVTSFKNIRKKMNPKKWKNLQRFAYLFYLLLYVHILLAYMPSARHGKVKSIVNVIVYSAVFFTYAAMRISKALAKKHKESERRICVSLSVASAALFMAVTLIASVPAVQAKSEVPASSSSESAVSSSHANTVSSVSSRQAVQSKSVISSENIESEKSSTKNVSSAIVSSVVNSESSKSSSFESTSSKSMTSSSSVTSSALQSSVQFENTVTEIEEITESVQDEQKNETEPEQETSEAQISDAPSVNSEESEQEIDPVSEPEPEPEKNQIYNDGEYSASCYEEDDDVRVMISVKIIIENDKIIDIQADSNETDTWYIDNVLNSVVPLILEREGTALNDIDDIDAVSGATLSSNGVKRAVKDALNQAMIARE